MALGIRYTWWNRLSSPVERHSLHWQPNCIADRGHVRPVEKVDMRKLIARIQERTGIYSLGFNPNSFMGIALPFGFVVVVGGILAFLVI